jgi:hypothetical protein
MEMGIAYLPGKAEMELKREMTAVFLLLSLWLLPAQAADIPLATVVRFNTLCATCHEGECSGRLSFDLGIQATENHIRRHAGEVDRNVWRDLARLLAHTKQVCAYYPMAVDIPKDRHWNPERLAELHNARENAWFIPLGHLPAGRYRATLEMNGQMEGIAQIISAGFDVADFPLQCAESGQIAFFFVVDRSSLHYLRFKFGNGHTLASLDIQTAD